MCGNDLATPSQITYVKVDELATNLNIKEAEQRVLIDDETSGDIKEQG